MTRLNPSSNVILAVIPAILLTFVRTVLPTIAAARHPGNCRACG